MKIIWFFEGGKFYKIQILALILEVDKYQLADPCK